MAKDTQIPVLNSGAITRFKNIASPFLRGSSDLILAGGILLVVSLLIIPMPPFALDIFLAINIAISIIILLIAVYLVKPLEFSAFPTILLVVTLYRLGLNVASTRLILSEANAGEIIHAFGTFVIKGNYVVGIIIFLILLVINFVVIIKGSTRIAEVAARFTLDALPGKQMSIDADLNAGYISEQDAKRRREELTRESDFYGSMDGAAKFIKGDAIAGIIITAVNIIGGFVIGVAQLDMSITDALSTYTILTIGDGLVSQIPSLLVSVAGGMVVTRSGADSTLDIQVRKQFGAKPRVFAVASFALLVIGVLPGFPFIPFFVLSAASGVFSFYRTRSIKAEQEAELRRELTEQEKPPEPQDRSVEELLRVDPVEIELGYSLIALVDESQGGDVFKRITNVRKQLATELGIILPPVRVRDNLRLEPEEYVIKIRGNEVTSNTLHPNMMLAMNPGTADGELSGIHVTEPVFGLPAVWIGYNDRENAEISGYTVVESATVLTTHLTELLRRNANKLLTRQDVKHLLDNLKEDYPALLEEITPEHLPVSVIQKVMQNLLSESIPVRDLPMIIESLLEYYKVTQNVEVLTEYVRHNLSETIKKLYQDEKGVIHAIALDFEMENQMTNKLQTKGQSLTGPTLGFAPEQLKQFNKNISKAIDDITLAGHLPTIICSAQLRPYLKKMIYSQFPMVNVISYTELPADTDIEIISSVGIVF